MATPSEETVHSLAYWQFLAGGLSGFIEIICFHPLDVVKTRMQIQGAHPFGGEVVYTCPLDAIVKIYRYEGLFSLWKGIVPPICVETPKRGGKFLMYESLKPYFQFGAPKPTPLTHAMAGSMAAILESFIVNPFEVVKITQQAHREKHLKTLSVVKYIIKHDGYGIKGLYRGITALVARNAVFHFGFFGFYNALKDIVPSPEDKTYNILRKIIIAGLASSLACVMSVTLDMAKCRIQGPQPVKGKVKYQWTISTIKTTFKEEGFRSLFKGLGAMILRVGPGGAMLLVTYEYLFEFLKSQNI
ncbi:mitochondrial 2-oxodicarboxylate carrier [Drosophila sechellia]|uniref:Mitochondrial 2-oxodicarboxylate carrier n=1 Tax=Drosophila sechellia TaxID=7238 RepID=B4HYU5_DROSE|nr:mitochondrial 2-oxodicarboxylate carrier [Drosophila sechellia]EDW52225.1 GM12561 [Drosophila sechellia]